MFVEKIKHYQSEGKALVYLDESGFAQSMPRVYGYAPLGQRCHDVHDWQAKGRVNAIGALYNSSLITICLFQGSINADVFYSWVTNALLPSVPQNSVIIMDNARFHKRHDIIDVLLNAHHNVEFLPPYSPDLNPIEKKWAQAKALRKRLRCDVDALFSLSF
jgi:transposase